MNPFVLIRKSLTDTPHPKDGTILLYACGACGRTHNPKQYADGADAALEAAEHCCEARVCVECSAPTLSYRSLCDECSAKAHAATEQRRIEAAEKVPVATCTSPVLYGDDQYFGTVEDLLDHLQHHCDLADDDFPVVAWCCDEVPPQLDADRVIDSFTEDLELPEELELTDVVTDLSELRTSIAAWNAKQSPKLWMPTNKRCVLINKTDISANAE